MFYVYYDKETRSIISITNEKNDSLENYIVKEKQEVIDFITGAKNTNEYVIDQNFNFVQIERHNDKFEVNQTFHKIQKATNPDLEVVHKDKWIFKNKTDVNGLLYFAVTEKDNPNALIRIIYFNGNELDKEVEFQYPAEHNIDNVSIWILHKTFSVCSLESQ